MTLRTTLLPRVDTAQTNMPDRGCQFSTLKGQPPNHTNVRELFVGIRGIRVIRGCPFAREDSCAGLAIGVFLRQFAPVLLTTQS